MAKKKKAEESEFDAAAFEATHVELDDAHRRIASLERSLMAERGAKNRVRQLNGELNDMKQRLDFVTAVENANIARPNWTKLVKKNMGKNHAILSVLLSDLHLDEVVNPDEVEGQNAYNRDIAEMRIRKITSNIEAMADREFSGLKVDGVEVLFGGDLVTGALHDLQETNQDYTLGTCVYWIGILAEVVERLHKKFGRVMVRCVVGNHGRNTLKPRTKGRVRDNFDWLIVKMIEREFRDNDEVTFHVPESADVQYDIYNVRYLGTHGDQFRGGNGIAGIFSAVLHGQKKKLLRNAALPDAHTFDVLWHGHFHQSYSTTNLIGNGSTKGMDEYAYLNNFGFEVPSQTLWVTTPEHGLTSVQRLFCMDRAAEGW